MKFRLLVVLALCGWASAQSAGLAGQNQTGRLSGSASISGTGRIGAAAVSLAKIDVTPISITLNLGQTQAFLAIGTFTDNSTQDLTGSAVWTSSNPATASISVAPATFICNATGIVTITAAVGTVFDTSQLTCQGSGVPPVQFTTTSLPGGQIGQPYLAQLAIQNGTAPFFYGALQALPNGLTLNSSTGQISGTPNGSAGSFPVTFQVVDSALPPTSDVRTLTINISAASSSDQATLPRAYADDICPSPVVNKNVDGTDYPATNAGLLQCINDGIAAGSNWGCNVAPRTNVGQIVLPVVPTGRTSCITLRSKTPIGQLPFGAFNMKQYVENGTGLEDKVNGQNAKDNAKRWIVESVPSSGATGIMTAVPDGAGNVPHHYAIYDLEARVQGPTPGDSFTLAWFGHNDSTQATAALVPHDIFLHNWYIHGSDAASLGVQQAILMNAANLGIFDFVCTEIHETGTESHCLSGDNGPGPFEMYNAYTAGGSVNTIFGGSFSSIPDLMTQDVYFSGVYATRPLVWLKNGQAWNNKNRFELKRAGFVLVEKSVFENSWNDGQTGGCLLNQVRATEKGQTIHDITYRNLIVRHCHEFFDGILGSGGGPSGSGDGPSMSMDHVTISNILAYDISASRFDNGNNSGRGISPGNDGSVFGAQAPAITSQTRDAAGNTTVIVATAPPQIVSGLHVVVAGATNGFNGTFPISQVISSTKFAYTGPAGAGSSTGGTATLTCDSHSDGAGNVTTQCPDTNCGAISPCNGGLEIAAGEWIVTANCANPAFNVSQVVAPGGTNQFALTITYPWTAAPPNTTTQCTLLNHEGAPYHLFVNHVAVYGRQDPYLMIVNLGGLGPIARSLTIKNTAFFTETSGSYGFFSGGLGDGQLAQTGAFDVSTMQFHHVVLGKKTPSNYNEYHGDGVAINPPLTIYGPANLNCSGVPDLNCAGLAGNYAYPNPDAGGQIIGYTASGSTATVTTNVASDFLVGQTIQQTFFGSNTFPQIGTIAALTANNTSNCGPIGYPSAVCTGIFPQKSTDPANTNALQQIIEPLPGHLTYKDFGADYMYPGFNGLKWCQWQVWFKYGQFGHYNIGEDISQPAQVAARLANTKAMGCDVVWIDWYSRDDDNGLNDDTTLEISRQLAQGVPAGLKMVTMYDQGSLKHACPPGPGDQLACIEAKAKLDWDYLNAQYFNKPYYLRGNKGDNKPMFPFFVTEANYPDTNWTTFWNDMRAYSNAYTFTSPTATGLNFIHRRSNAGMTHPQTDGNFAWVPPSPFTNVIGNTSELCWQDPVGDTGTPCNPATGVGSGVQYLNSMYQSGTNGCASAPTKYCIGGIWAKFDWSNSGYADIQKRIFSQYGKVLQLTAAKAAANGYSASNQLYAIGLSTLNDFGEGTGIENGVDSGWSVTVSRSGNILTYTGVKADATYVDPSTIAKTEIWFTDPASGNTFLYSTISGWTGTTPTTISLASIPAGTWDIRVHLVARAWISDVFSPAVSFPNSQGTLTAENGAKVVTAVTTSAPFTYSYANPTVITTVTGNLGLASTGHDYHDFKLCTGVSAPTASCLGKSVFAAGGTEAADDGTMLGPDIDALDLAMVDPTHPGSGGGGGLPLVALAPTNLSFGSQTVGTSSAALPVVVSNPGAATLVISQVVTSGDYSQTNNCTSLAVGASCTVNVTFRPTVAGARSGNLTITDNAANSPQIVPLSGTGVSGGAVPTVTALSPAQGFAAGGESVTITGTNFVSGALATFGSTTAATTFVNSTTLTAVAPIGTIGTANISVSTSGGTGTLLSAYLYLSTPATTCTFTGDNTCTLSYNDQFGAEVRTTRIFVPSGLSAKPAMVVYYHGSLTGTGTSECENAGWITKASAAKFIMLCPQGLPVSSGNRTWNSYYNQATYAIGHPPDDTYFTREMAALIYKNLASDPKKVFLTGFSVGKGIYRFAVDAPDVIAAIGGGETIYLGQNASPGNLTFPTTTLPFSVIALHGTADTSFPYCGQSTGIVLQTSVDDLANHFAGTLGNNCAPLVGGNLCTAFGGTATAVTKRTATSCSGGTEVRVYQLLGGVHLPYGNTANTFAFAASGGNATTPSNPDLAGASEVDAFWSFFNTHPKP